MLPKIKISLERWKWNSQFEVWVSNQGNIKNRNKEIVVPRIKDNGYLAIHTKGGYISVHRLIMSTWNPVANMQTLTIDHLNHNKRDNSLKNLEWVTRAENERRAKEDLLIDKEATNLVSVNGVQMTLDECVAITKSIAQAGWSDDRVRTFIKQGLEQNKKKIYGMEIKVCGKLS